MKSNYGIGYSDKVIKLFSKRNVKNNAAYLLPYLQPTMNLIDVGCGPASITIEFAKILSEGKVIGVDIENSQIEKAEILAEQLNVDNISFQKADIQNLPFEDGIFDLAHTNGVLCQIKDSIVGLSELKRIIKPGGIVASREPDMETYLFYPDNPILLEALQLSKRAVQIVGGDYYIGRKLKKLYTQVGFSKIIASASCDTYGGSTFSVQEACDAMINDWEEAPWGKYVFEQKWASLERIKDYQNAFTDLAKDPGAFISLTWFEVIGIK